MFVQVIIQQDERYTKYIFAIVVCDSSQCIVHVNKCKVHSDALEIVRQLAEAIDKKGSFFSINDSILVVFVPNLSGLSDN